MVLESLKELQRIIWSTLKATDSVVWHRALFILSSLLFLGLGARYVPASIDDLYIILRYVENAADGHGLVFNLGERVEGYTCFGWVGILTWLTRIGWPAYWAAKLIGVLCGGILLWLCYQIAREFWRGTRNSQLMAFVPVFLLCVNPDFLYWSVAGLETSLFATLAILSLALIVMETRLAREQVPTRWLVSIAQGIISSLAILVRPEGLVLPVFSVLATLIMWRRKHEWLWYSIVMMLTALIPVGAFFLWRHTYYGDWLPNTYYAKVGGDILDRIASGKHYLFGCLARNAFGWLGRHGQTAWPGVLLFFVIPALATPFVQRKRAHLVVLLWSIMFSAIVVWEGGDWMPHHRFLVPVLGCWMLLLSHSLLQVVLYAEKHLKSLRHRFTAAAAIGLLILFFADSVRFNLRHAPSIPLDRPDSWPIVFTRHILQHAKHGTLAASDIGLIGYSTRYRIIDMAGLVDRHVARSPGSSFQKDYDVAYVLDQEPDFIILTDQHCVAEDRIRQDDCFLGNYEFVMKREGHALYVRKAAVSHKSTPQI